MNKITLDNKVQALRKANPRLSEANACLLLGITKEQLNTERSSELFETGKSIFGDGNIFEKMSQDYAK